MQVNKTQHIDRLRLLADRAHMTMNPSEHAQKKKHKVTMCAVKVCKSIGGWGCPVASSLSMALPTGALRKAML